MIHVSWPKTVLILQLGGTEFEFSLSRANSNDERISRFDQAGNDEEKSTR